MENTRTEGFDALPRTRGHRDPLIPSLDDLISVSPLKEVTSMPAYVFVGSPRARCGLTLGPTHLPATVSLKPGHR
jgi:hypothetical protein